jgi:ligand-binding sensor domain-containing protein
MSLRIILIFLLLFQNFGELIVAQQSYFSKNYTTENGLPHNHVRCLAQDSTGFLWIATWDGLSGMMATNSKTIIITLPIRLRRVFLIENPIL